MLCYMEDVCQILTSIFIFYIEKSRRLRQPLLVPHFTYCTYGPRSLKFDLLFLVRTDGSEVGKRSIFFFVVAKKKKKKVAHL